MNAFATVYWFATGERMTVLPWWVVFSEDTDDMARRVELHNKLTEFAERLGVL